MTRRSRWLLALLAVLLVIAGGLHWASRPQRVTAAVLDGVGAALGLELTASGISEYRLRGEPRLVVRDLVARQPGAPDALLRARRLDIALPWSTLRARGDVLEATRLEVDDAVFDLRALRRWQATRPPSDAPRIPTLTRGLRVRRSAIVDDGWRINDVSIDAPHIDPERALTADVAGTLRSGAISTPFDIALELSRPAPDAQATLRGHIAAIAPSWRLPATVHARGHLHLDAAPARIDDLRLGAVARFAGADQPIPFTVGLAGQLLLSEGLHLQRAGAMLRGDGIVPTLDAGGRVEWNEALVFDLAGTLARWPDGWPALPAPLGRPRSPVPFVLAYAGPVDLSGTAELEARHAGAAVDIAFASPDVLEWNTMRSARSPLPPLAGRLTADRMDIAGATLEGIELVIEDDASDSHGTTDASGMANPPDGVERSTLVTPDDGADAHDPLQSSDKNARRSGAPGHSDVH